MIAEVSRLDLLVVAIPVSKPKRNVPIAANSAMPKVYNNPMLSYIHKGHKSFRKKDKIERRVKKKEKQNSD
jgi:uncharacterized membrane protein YkgB